MSRFTNTIRRVLLAGALAAVTLAVGCGGGGQQPETQEPPQQPQTRDQPEKEASPQGDGDVRDDDSGGGARVDGRCGVVSGQRNTYRVGQAGTVRVQRAEDDDLRLASARPQSGWRMQAEERRGDDVEVDFVRSGRKIEFKAEIDDGRIEVECDDDDEDGDDD